MSNRPKTKSKRKEQRKRQEQRAQQQAAQRQKASAQKEQQQTEPDGIKQEPTNPVQIQQDPIKPEPTKPEKRNTKQANPVQAQSVQADRTEQEKKKRKRRVVAGIILVLLILLLCLFLKSCRARDEPAPQQPDISDTERIYEEDRHADYPALVPDGNNKRLNLAVSDSYVISEETPFFYIGFPKENIYDVVFTLKDSGGQELYHTGYVAPGTNVAIDGTGFLDLGEQRIDCLVSVYDHESGTLISDCTTVVLNIKYE